MLLLTSDWSIFQCVCCKSATDNGKANLTRLLEKTVEYGADPGHNLVGGLMHLVKVVFEGELSLAETSNAVF